MYEIIIKKLQTITKNPSQSYENLHRKDSDGEDKWGYVTKPGHEVVEWVEVFKQQNESCDILAVVAGFNGVTFNK